MERELRLGGLPKQILEENFLGNRENDCEVRAAFLNEARRLGRDFGFCVPSFTIMSWSDLKCALGVGADSGKTAKIREWSREERRSYFQKRLYDGDVGHIQSFADDVASSRIMIRPCPLDEGRHPHLSFAGVYPSYIPPPGCIVEGLAVVLAERFRPYADYYYQRHGLDSSDRGMAVMYMEIVEDAVIHGTGYAVGPHLRTEYVYKPPFSARGSDRVVVVRYGEEEKASAPLGGFEEETNFRPRFFDILRGLSDHFRMPVDVEFLVDRGGTINVVQVRRMSQAHLKNWGLYHAGCYHADDVPTSAILNSPGCIRGRVVDLRRRKFMPRQDLGPGSQSAIYVINHASLTDGTSSRDFLISLLEKPNVRGLMVVVDHGDLRIRDHLQYAAVEDLGIGFIVQTTDPKTRALLKDDREVMIRSWGNRVEVDSSY